MNGLYGYPMSGVQAMGYMAAEPEEAVNTVWDVARGTAAKKLEGMKRTVKENTARLNRLRSEAKTLKNESGTAALEVYRLGVDENVKARSALNKAIRDHNEIAQALKDYTFGAVSPSKVGMAGMGAIQIPVAAILAVAAAVSVAALALANSWSIITGANLKTKGYIDQMSDLVTAGGGAITAGGIAMTRTAWAVIGVVAAIAGFQLLQDYRGRKSGASVPAQKQLDLKPVMGAVE